MITIGHTFVGHKLWKGGEGLGGIVVVMVVVVVVVVVERKDERMKSRKLALA